MSIGRRWASGGMAGGVRVAVGLGLQLALTPVFLGHWSASQYGGWLVVLALGPVLTALDVGHQNHLAYVFISEPDERTLGRLFASSLVAGVGFGLLGLAITGALVASGAIALVLRGAAPAVVEQAERLVLIQAGVWMMIGSLGGLLTRAMARIGAFPRAAWWGAAEALLVGLAPAGAVIAGGDLMAAGLAMTAASVLVGVPMLADFARLWAKDPRRLARPDMRLAGRNAVVSLGITARDLLILLRQQGIRLVLAPLIGLAALTAFATMRTGANLAMQGLNAVLWPLEPELLRLLRRREAARLEVALSANGWLLLILVAPGLIALQMLVPEVFEAWTRGRIAFDPALFALLSAGVVVFAFSQTAAMVVRGTRQVRIQVVASLVSAAVVLGGIALTATAWGAQGAALALLLGEVCIAMMYQPVARRWVERAGLVWPGRLAVASGLAGGGCVVALLAMAWRPSWTPAVVVVWAVSHLALCGAAARHPPRLARERIAGWARRATGGERAVSQKGGL